MSVDFYKIMYEASKEDSKESQKKLFQYVLKTLRGDLGVNYYDFIDFVALDTLKGVVEGLEDGGDMWETPDNKARDLSAAYRMVEYFSLVEDYQAFIKSRRDINNETS